MSARPAIPAEIVEAGALAILRGLDPDAAVRAAEAIHAGGIAAVEVTLDSPGALDAISALARDSQPVGAGTVLDVSAAQAAIDAGADFLVTPECQPSLISWAAERGIPIFPGALTPSEIRQAWGAGAAAVKLFPAVGLAFEYVRALAAPLGGIPLIPTGGVTGSNAQAWRDAGAVAVAVGGWLTASEDPAILTQRAAAVRVRAERF